MARFVGSSNWLDQNHLFRPEQAQTVPTEQAEKYDADVTAVQFLGSSYQLQLNHNGQDWTYISPDGSRWAKRSRFICPVVPSLPSESASCRKVRLDDTSLEMKKENPYA